MESFQKQFGDPDSGELMEDRERLWLKELTARQHVIETELNEKRALGDSFEVVVVEKRETSKTLLITGEGQILFCDVNHSRNPEIPSDMSAYVHFNLTDIGNGLFEMMTCRRAYHVSDVRSFQQVLKKRRLKHERKGTDGEGSLTLELRWKSDDSPLLFKAKSEGQELMAVLRYQLKIYEDAYHRQEKLMRERWKTSQIAYDSNSDAHEKKLMLLWKTVFPHCELESRKSKQWSQLGFQGRDPASDFRGMGVLGLDQLLYFSTHHIEDIRRILMARRSYPFACAGINLTLLLMQTLGMSAISISAKKNNENTPLKETPLLRFLATCDEENGLEELYCHVFLLFDALWVRMDAEYMDFSRVLQTLKVEMGAILERRPHGMQQFGTWVNQTCVAVLSGQRTLPQIEEDLELDELSNMILGSLSFRDRSGTSPESAPNSLRSVPILPSQQSSVISSSSESRNSLSVSSSSSSSATHCATPSRQLSSSSQASSSSASRYSPPSDSPQFSPIASPRMYGKYPSPTLSSCVADTEMTTSIDLSI